MNYNDPMQFSATANPVDVKSLMREVYMWMGLGLLVTALVAWYTATSGLILQINQVVFFGAIIAELALVWWLSARVMNMSATMARGLFIAYAALNGFTLSLIFIVYAGSTVGTAFLITAGMFGAMTVVAMTAPIDLSKFGAFFAMGLIGLVIAMVVNIFLRSSGLEYIISIVGVLLFTGLTAYDTQRIVKMAQQANLQGGEMTAKMGIMGALTLYLDFINLFLFVLRLLGRRN
jgi:FtsH-binding integral membrane protein